MAKSKSRKKKGSSEGNPLVFSGRLEVTKGGLGFVIVEGLPKDIKIRPDRMHNALNGDTVEVQLLDKYDIKKPEGKVIAVKQRKQMEFSGVVELHPHFAFLVPDNDKINVDIYIPLHLLKGAKNGDKAVAKIVEWNGKTKNPVGEIVSIYTDASVNEIAMQSILLEHAFPLSFPEEVLEDAARYEEVISSAEVKKRKDFRDTLTFTIDPVDAKDFDDAISIKPLKGGYYEVGVHIADVSHYIETGSALDIEAYKRATSVYLPDRVLPMLPERLSNELCSLRPNEDKYTFSAVFTINKTGKIKDYWLGRTLIHSNRRFTYEEVQEIIDGASGDYKEEVLLLNTISQNLRAARFKKGAINFSSQEVRFKLDENAVPVGIVVKESKESHQLIEELMLLANKHVAEYVSEIVYKEKPVPFPYRVHDVPDENKLKVFASFASKFGVALDLSAPENIATSFNAMLQKVHGKPEQHVLEQLGIRTMAKAVYTTDNIGHYGLGFAHYCHFTSPIRRYPDVLVHRILQQCLDNKIKPIKQLDEMCRHCSDQERRAMEAERSANKYKQVEYMLKYVGEDFDAVISGVSAYGFWAETIEHKCEGMVSVNDLSDFDQFEFKEQEYALVGLFTGLKFTMGEHVKIKVIAANLDKRRIDYGLAEVPATKLSRRIAGIKSPKNKKKINKRK